MEIKTKTIIAGLSEAEVEQLRTSGGIIGSLKKAFETEEITAIDDQSKQLLEAIKQVIEAVLSK